MSQKILSKFAFRHPLFMLCIMMLCNILFILAWWPKTSLGQLEFKWIQLIWIFIADVGFVIELKRLKHKNDRI